MICYKVRCEEAGHEVFANVNFGKSKFSEVPINLRVLSGEFDNHTVDSVEILQLQVSQIEHDFVEKVELSTTLLFVIILEIVREAAGFI